MADHLDARGAMSKQLSIEDHPCRVHCALDLHEDHQQCRHREQHWKVDRIASRTSSSCHSRNSANHEQSAPPPEAEGLSSSLTQTYEPPRRKILCNPSAGEVYRRECGSSWRVDADEKLRLANLKAKEEQQEKRRWGLAKQIQDGLMHTFGMNYGVAELSTLLKTGIALKTTQQQQQQEAGGGAAKPTELGSHEVAYVQLLAAAEKYDLKQVVMLLDKFPKGRNPNSSSSKLTKG